MIRFTSPRSMMAERCLSKTGEVWLSIRPVGATTRLFACRVSAMFMMILTSGFLLITLWRDDFRKLYDLPEGFLKRFGVTT